MAIKELFTGDDWAIAVTLKRNGLAFDVSGATAIKAAIVTDSWEAPSQLVADVTLSAGATGADWANGVVVVEVDEATTGPLTPQRAFLEIQVDFSGDKTTWPRNELIIKKGTIA